MAMLPLVRYMLYCFLFCLLLFFFFLKIVRQHNITVKIKTLLHVVKNLVIKFYIYLHIKYLKTILFNHIIMELIHTVFQIKIHFKYIHKNYFE